MVHHIAMRFAAISLTVAACATGPDGDKAAGGVSQYIGLGNEITVAASDGVAVFGSVYFGELDDAAPLVHLFHQGGGDGRGEYAPIIPWLNDNGIRAIAWDQRKGGSLFGEDNRTAQNWVGDQEGYCDAYPDIEAAVLGARDLAGAARVVVWGSSYSGSLVFKLAAERAEFVDAVIAFSPASGGPMADCKASLFASELEMPAFALRPASEMERESSQLQRTALEAAGVKFAVVENGVHGSSMLVDERTGHDMSSARAEVMEWLASAIEDQ